MFYELNKEQAEIIKVALTQNSDLRSINDLKRVGCYELLLAERAPEIPESAVMREIAHLKCNAQNEEQFAEFHKSDDYSRFSSWAAGEIEFTAQSFYFDMLSFKDNDLRMIFAFIHHMARIAREKAIRRTYNDNKSGPGSEAEFRRVSKISMRFLGIEPDKVIII